MKKIKQKFPKGWNLARVKRLANHYETMDDAQAARKDDAAWRIKR